MINLIRLNFIFESLKNDFNLGELQISRYQQNSKNLNNNNQIVIKSNTS